MQRTTAPSASAALARTRGALGRRDNWLQLLRFCLVGASGYVVNLAVYTLLLKVGDVHYLLAATGSFLVAVTSNYTWNRLWTFRGQRGHVAYQGLRFLVVSTIALAANLVILQLLVDSAGVGKVLAQAIAIVLVTPLNFVGNKLWSFRLAAALAAALRPAPASSSRRPAARCGDLRSRHAPATRRRAASLGDQLALAVLAFAAPAGRQAPTDPDGAAGRDAVRALRGQCPPDREAGDRDPLPQREGCGLARPVPAQAGDGRRVPRGDGRVGRQGLVGQGGPDRARQGRRPHRRGDRGLDGATGRLDDGARRRRRVRRQDDQLRLAMADVLRALRRRPRRPAAAVLAPQPRPARAALVLDLTPLLQRGRDLLERAARVSPARLPARPLRLDCAARPAAAHVGPRLAGVAARGRLRLPRRLPRRAQRRGAARA